ncbi:MAG TPA: hypothetical protein VE619_00970 [Nitrososphaeraceae archaeon]|nr:hypothetical protein [Nitrososphaeraceae archaeon]
MSNTNASEENAESPSTYGKDAYRQYRKDKKQEKNRDPKEFEGAESGDH